MNKAWSQEYDHYGNPIANRGGYGRGFGSNGRGYGPPPLDFNSRGGHGPPHQTLTAEEVMESPH